MKTPIRVGVIFEHFGPYHVARIKAASEHLNVTPIELFGTCQTYAWQRLAPEFDFAREVLFPNASSDCVNKDELTKKLPELLNRLSPDVLAVPGWALPGAVASLKWAAQNEVPAIVMSESKWDDHPRSLAKEKIKQSILAHVSAGIVGAESHRDYLIRLGMSHESVFMGYDAVDNDYFADGAARARSNQVQLRHEFGLPEKFFFASNRFVEKKNLQRLIEAFSDYARTNAQPWSLVMAGDGPLRNQLENLVERHSLQKLVRFVGFLQYDELPNYYGLASAFVHVSTTEQWGLVVNEGAAAGLPLIVSRSCGCAPHLVEDRGNGLVCDAFSTDSITRSLAEMAELTDSERAAMARRSVEIVANFGTEQFGRGLQSAVEYSLQNQRTGSVLDRVLMSMLS